MAEPIALKYRAFISYSHTDTSWAKWLHRALEGFTLDKDLVGRETAVGQVPKALKPVFRDRDDFTAGHTLTEQTLAALDASHALIVLCSSSAAKSQYVNEEVRLFKSRHSDRPVVPLIVAGKPGDAELECFPPALKFELDTKGRVTKKPIELLAADAREDGDGKALALAKIVAGLLDVSSDEVFRRSERERRRKGRVRNAIIAVLAILGVAASGSAVYAWQQLNTNEAFLNATLERATDIVSTAVKQAETYGVPRKATLELLTRAEGLFDDMARLGRPTPELRQRKAWMLVVFARNYEILGDTGKWRQRAEQANQLFAGLVAEKPKDSAYLRGLGVAQAELGRVLQDQGNVVEALAHFQNGLTTFETLAAAEPEDIQWQRDLASSYGEIGGVLIVQGNLSEALRLYQKSLNICERLAKGSPENADAQLRVAGAHEKVGDVLIAQGKLFEAQKAFQASSAISERLAKASPGNAQRQIDLSKSYRRAGDLYLARGDPVEALKSFEESLTIRERVAKADPTNAAWQHGLAVAYERLGTALGERGEIDAALQSFEQSLSVIERVAKADPANATWQADLAVAYDNVGDVLGGAQGKLVSALELFKESLAIRERLAQADLSNADLQGSLSVSQWKLAAVFARQGDVPRALEALRQGRAIILRLQARSPDNTKLKKDLANFDAKIAELEQAKAAEPPIVQPGQAAP